MFSEKLEDRKKVAAEVGKACREVGFFYAQNHSLSDETINKTFTAVEKFFALPLEEKMEVHIHKSKVVRGYEPLFETKMDPNSKGGKSQRQPI
jgi:isopenicillin N synthase-like dioxygenase